VTDERQERFAARLIGRIREHGPISIAEYMEPCNAHYYATRDPLGAAGDFTTAPEISQVFGELLGAWAADYWQRMGAPDPVRLVELGPGRGTLMADLLRAMRRVPRFHAAAKLHLIEQSPVLRRMQADKLATHTPQFHDDLSAVPAGPMLLIANEFFDALPIRQFEQQDGYWYERLVGLDGKGLTMRLAAQPSFEIPMTARREDDGKVCALSPANEQIATAIGARLQRDGGAALIIDYGYFPSALGDTLQALRRHRPISLFDSPGESDLTAHVDFEAVARAAASAGAAIHGPTSQAAFLVSLGISAREAALLNAATPEQQIAIRSGCRRLIEPAQMGTLFKVLALTAQGGPVPAGFAA
jgi:NADH dehydrogenase [ubiquinone] 1 alpha subcomplex assembly factor 7